MKKRYHFPVSQQSNLLGQAWKNICDFSHIQARRFEEKKNRRLFFGPDGMSSYDWSFPPAGTSAAYGRFMIYYIQESNQPEGSIFETFLKETTFESQLEEVLADRLGEAELALIEFMGMHEDQNRFYGRDLLSGKEILYSPHDYLDWWEIPTRPWRDSCYLQVYRVPLHSVNLDMPECVVLCTPTMFTGIELRSRSLTCLRLNPGGLSALKLEQKLWSHAHWIDFCIDRPAPGERFLQALNRWKEIIGKEMSVSWSFPCFLREKEVSDYVIDLIVADLDGTTVAGPELEWILETLWNEHPRLPMWGKTPLQMNENMISVEMLESITRSLRKKGRCNILPDFVLMARALK